MGFRRAEVCPSSFVFPVLIFVTPAYPPLCEMCSSTDQAVYCLILSLVCGIHLRHSTWIQSKEFTLSFYSNQEYDIELLESAEKSPAMDTKVRSVYFYR